MFNLTNSCYHRSNATLTYVAVTLSFGLYEKMSFFQALYEVALLLPHHQSDSALHRQLCSIVQVLCNLAVQQDIPYDAAALSVSCLILFITHMFPENPDQKFAIICSYLGSYDTQKSCSGVYEKQLTSDELSEHISFYNAVDQILNSAKTDNEGALKFSKISKITINTNVMIAVAHGLLKTTPPWVFDHSSSFDLLEIYFCLEQLVQGSTASQLYQVFVILDLWTVTVSQRFSTGDSCLGELAYNNEQLETICSLNHAKAGKLFQLISAHWESTVKGMS